MPLSSPGSVTFWIGRLKAGDPAAAEKLWKRYFRRLVGLARKNLEGAPRRLADEEDAALSAFASFCRRAGQGHFPQLLDRDDLWQLLVVITLRKSINQVNRERCQKRGGAGQNLPASAEAESAIEEATLEQIISSEPTPELVAQVAEEYRRLLANLGDAELQSIALLKMEGDTTAEIAAKLQCAPRTIERRLQLIRKIWEKELAS
jgi:DNA-directed RNA polymerase specialized sigma24 family protein